MNTRANIYKHDSKKKGFSASRGSYEYRKAGDRYFVLRALRTGKTRSYESPSAAIRDGWYVAVKGR